MSTVKLGQYEVTGQTSWDKPDAPGAQLYLSLQIKSLRPLPEQVKLTLPAAWAPGTWAMGANRPPGTAAFKDPQGGGWEPTYDSGTTTFTLDQTQDGAQPVDGLWKLNLEVPLLKPADESSFEVMLDLKTPADPAGPLKLTVDTRSAEAQGWVVRFTSRVADDDKIPATIGLPPWTKVLLEWEIKNMTQDAVLQGILPDGSSQMLIGKAALAKGSREVAAIGTEVYTLTAYVDDGKGGSQQKEVRSCVVSAAPRTDTDVLDVYPQSVLPGGPIACSWTLPRSTAIEFNQIGSTLATPRQLASITEYDRAGEVVADKKAPQVRTLAFSLPWGPVGSGDTTETWTLSGSITEASKPNKQAFKKKVIHSQQPRLLTSDSGVRQLGTKDAPPLVNGLAAGRYFRPDDALGGVPSYVSAHWVATATKQGLEVRSLEGDNSADVVQKETSADYLGVGAGVGLTRSSGNPNSDEWVLAVRRKPGSRPQLVELKLPGTKTSPEVPAEGSILDIDESKVQIADTARVLSVGTRVYVLGDRSAASCDRSSSSGGFVAEPLLAMVAYPSWDVVALPGKGGPQAPEGFFFALERNTGMMLRFDVVAGQVGDPAEAASPCGNVLPLHVLLEKQLKLSAPGAAELDAYLLAKRSPTKRAAHEGWVLREDGKEARPIDSQSVLFAFNGILVARSEVVDSFQKMDRVQGRAYDPRLNVWVRCGHAFHGVAPDARGQFACTGGRLLRRGPGMDEREPFRFWSIKGDLTSLAGFRGTNFTPIDRARLGVVRWRGQELKAGGELTPGQYLMSPAGTCKLELDGPTGALVLVRSESGDRTPLIDVGQPLAKARLTACGDLELCTADGTAVWRASQRGGEFPAPAPDSRLVLDDQGRLAIRSGDGRELWHSPRDLGDRLLAGQFMVPGDRLTSPNRQYTLHYQEDGNLVRSPLAWESKTSGGHRVVMQQDGRLEVYSQPGQAPLWSTEKRGGEWGDSYKGGKVMLRLDDRGALCVWPRDIQDWGQELWHATNHYEGELKTGQFLLPDDSVTNGSYKLIYQADGNLVHYREHTQALWATGTDGASCWRVVLQPDANLIVYADRGKIGWSADRHGGQWGGQYGSSRLLVGSNGALQILSADNKDLWHPGLEVDVRITTQLQWAADDRGLGSSRDLTTYKPVCDDGYYYVGQYAQGNHDGANGSAMLIKDISPNGSALRPPERLELVYTDRGSGKSLSYSIWRPIPPSGYKALGHIFKKGDDYHAPEIGDLRCVKESLVVGAKIGSSSIWSDRGSRANQDVTLYPIQPADDRGLAAGTYYAHPANESSRPPDDVEVYCVRAGCARRV